MRWQFKVGGQRSELIAQDELIQLVREGYLKLDSVVRREGGRNWVPLGTIPELVPKEQQKVKITLAPFLARTRESSELRNLPQMATKYLDQSLIDAPSPFVPVRHKKSPGTKIFEEQKAAIERRRREQEAFFFGAAPPASEDRLAPADASSSSANIAVVEEAGVKPLAAPGGAEEDLSPRAAGERSGLFRSLGWAAASVAAAAGWLAVAFTLGFLPATAGFLLGLVVGHAIRPVGEDPEDG